MPCQQSMAHPLVSRRWPRDVGGGDANTLNKQSRVADKECPTSQRLGRVLTTLPPLHGPS